MNDPLAAVDGTLLNASLTGFANKFQILFGLKSFALDTNNNPKRAMEAEQGGRPANLPYGWYAPSSLDFNSERGNATAIARIGSTTAIVQGETGTVKKAYMFPVTLPIEVTVRFSSIEEAMTFMCKSLLTILSKGLNFVIGAAGDSFTVEIDMGGNSASIPFPKIDDIDNVNGMYYEFVLSLTMKTKIGIVSDVAKFNNYGTVQLRGKVE